MQPRSIIIEAAHLIKGDGFKIIQVFSPNEVIPIARQNKWGCVRLITNGKNAWVTPDDILHHQLREEVQSHGYDLAGYYNSMAYIEKKADSYVISDVEIRYEDGNSERAIKQFFRMV